MASTETGELYTQEQFDAMSVKQRADLGMVRITPEEQAILDPMKTAERKDWLNKNKTKVLHELPPNYKDICKHIPAVKKQPAIVFTYAPNIYSPAGIDLRADLMVHEEVHIQRQSNPKEWWDRYLTDVTFRLSEELAAYRAQYAYIKANYKSSIAKQVTASIVEDLAGDMYGNMLTKSQAMTLITGYRAPEKSKTKKPTRKQLNKRQRQNKKAGRRK